MLGAMMAVMLAQTPGIVYGALVHEYMSGSADEAVSQVVALDSDTRRQGFAAFVSGNHSPDLLAAVAAMHTEAALRPRLGMLDWTVDQHFALAAGIIEVGAPRRLKRIGASVGTRVPVTPEFRYLWFVTVTTALENGGRPDKAAQLLENARVFFPQDPHILLLSGISEEMRASSRLVNAGEGQRRKALADAEGYLRASLALAPEGMETRLRLGRVLSQRGQFDEARGLLGAVSDVEDQRISYLASLFLGGLEDSAGNTAAAAQFYERAGSKGPATQASRLAASELKHRAGERQEAAARLPSAIGPANSFDPWWSYLFGEYWRVGSYLDALRKACRG
jgi:Tetratricopeptide repeat